MGRHGAALHSCDALRCTSPALQLEEARRSGGDHTQRHPHHDHVQLLWHARWRVLCAPLHHAPSGEQLLPIRRLLDDAVQSRLAAALCRLCPQLYPSHVPVPALLLCRQATLRCRLGVCGAAHLLLLRYQGPVRIQSALLHHIDRLLVAPRPLRPHARQLFAAHLRGSGLTKVQLHIGVQPRKRAVQHADVQRRLPHHAPCLLHLPLERDAPPLHQQPRQVRGGRSDHLQEHQL
mmetsp:Transcript_14386/g.37322  ORF Transcript_14386/g.37322 Transcript_14386/m.37322 type:complete len:234 (-) Transcript_14386:699-1400(-)